MTYPHRQTGHARPAWIFGDFLPGGCMVRFSVNLLPD
nr:MAG TPA: hypothetical protein [Caudoviricetes sp.]